MAYTKNDSAVAEIAFTLHPPWPSGLVLGLAWGLRRTATTPTSPKKRALDGPPRHMALSFTLLR